MYVKKRFSGLFFVVSVKGGNEQKFMGEGQMFKGKLIGVLEVQEARGDRMCQDALQELKTAIKASGEHKQKILIHIAVDGLKIRDEKSGVSKKEEKIITRVQNCELKCIKSGLTICYLIMAHPR